jgi:hypothetical protein
MARARGFFSVIQFCPDLDRGECANVGVVVAVPERGYLRTLFAQDNEAPKQRFGRDSYDDARLAVAKKALENRIREEGPEWRTPADLASFATKEGNHLLLTAPRAILIEHPDEELRELFDRLVYVEPQSRRRSPRPDLEAIFERRLVGVPLKKSIEVEVPHLGRLRVPYAYQNGSLNLVSPEGFGANAFPKANELAVKGHLLATHPGESGEKRQLVIVGGFAPSVSEDTKRDVEFVLREHDTRLVREDRMDAFIDEVRREAH